MEVKMPLPAGKERVLFERKLSGFYQEKELEEILSETETILNKACEELRIGKYSLVSYNLSVYAEDKNRLIGEVIEGGFFNSGKEQWEYSIREFQRRYKLSFKEIKKNYSTEKIWAEMFLVGVKESITMFIEAKEIPPRL